MRKSCGFKGVLLVTKHHDGFLLWPSRHSDYSVKNSPWRNGTGNVVREVADATRAAGLNLGLYLSPWDRNSPYWGTTQYNEYFVATMDELFSPTSGYGALFEFWLDYGHDHTIVTEEQLATYDDRRWIRLIRQEQPGAIIAPERDAFFPRNEAGIAPESNWSFREDWPRWAPYECPAALRSVRSWFWHPGEHPKSLNDMVEMYFTSVGRGCTLTLAVSPDSRGLIDPEDEARLREWRAALDDIFRENLALRRPVTASSTRPGATGWEPGAAVDRDADSFWASGESLGSLEVDLGAPMTVNVLELAEPIAYGQRITAFRLEAERAGQWETVARGTSVGYKRLLRFRPATAQRFRVVIENARASPALTQFGLYSAMQWEDRWAAQPEAQPEAP